MAGDDDYEIPESGAVFTFGRSRFAENLSSHFFIRNDPVMEISCGDEHTALVCGSGRVFLFGNNDYGQLGFGHTKVMNKPSCLKYLKPFHSTHVACGKGHTIISTACSRIFTFGYNSDGQLGIGDLNDRVVPQMIATGLSDEDSIVAVAAGCHHSAFLTESGDVYLWGSNSDGQCGAEEISYIPTPQKLQFDQPVTSISCGYYHTAFISLGQIYTFGEEDNGKLGRPDSSKNEPEKVELSENCTMVKCGGSQTMVLTETGVVYAFGSNFSGQLGIGNSEAERSVPTRVEFPDENTKVVQMSCGESHSAFVTDKGGLLTCGDSRHGKLCNEDESTNIASPTSIPMFENYFCTFVSCGGCHTMVLAKVRAPETDPVISVSQTKNVLPPLKTDTSHPELTNFIDDKEIEEENTEKEEQQNGDDNDECDSRSNTESNINNEEAASHLDEIYTEIEEIVSGKPEGDSKPPDLSPVAQINESNESDLVVATPETAIKKLFSVFKRKKSASAVLLSNKSEDKGFPNSSSQNAANTQKSKACVVL